MGIVQDARIQSFVDFPSMRFHRWRKRVRSAPSAPPTVTRQAPRPTPVQKYRAIRENGPGSPGQTCMREAARVPQRRANGGEHLGGQQT